MLLKITVVPAFLNIVSFCSEMENILRRTDAESSELIN